MAPSSRHSLLFISVYVITSVLNYGFGVALSWLFSPAQFGVLGVAQSILLLLAMVVGAGFAWTTTHDLAANGITPESNRRFRAALTANLALGVALGGGVWLGSILGIIPLGNAYARVIPLTSLVVVLLAVRAVFNGGARGLYHFTPVGINLIGEVVVKTVFGLALVISGAGVEGVMAAFAAGALISLLHSVIILRKTGWWKGSGWIDLRVVLASAPLFLGMVSTALMTNLDVLGIKFLSPAAISDSVAGYYQAAAMLSRIPVYIAQALALVTFSYAVGDKSNSRTGKIALDNPFFISALRAWYRLLLPAAVVLILTPQTVLRLFFPDHYLSSATTLQVLAVGGALLAMVTLLNTVFQASGSQRQGAMATAAGIITQLVMLVWLTPRYGAVGAAFSLVAAALVTLAWMALSLSIPFATLRSIRKIAARRWILAAIPHLVLAIYLLLFPAASDRLSAMISLSIAGILYLGSLFLPAQARAIEPYSATQALTRFVKVLLGG